MIDPAETARRWHDRLHPVDAYDEDCSIAIEECSEEIAAAIADALDAERTRRQEAEAVLRKVVADSVGPLAGVGATCLICGAGTSTNDYDENGVIHYDACVVSKARAHFQKYGDDERS